jgi:hypothetical protein
MKNRASYKSQLLLANALTSFVTLPSRSAVSKRHHNADKAKSIFHLKKEFSPRNRKKYRHHHLPKIRSSSQHLKTEKATRRLLRRHHRTMGLVGKIQRFIG